MPAWLNRIYVVLFALLPWSFDLNFGDWNLTVPAEPLTLVAGIGLLVVVIRQRTWPASGIAWVSVAWIVWQAATIAFSTMPVVSMKYGLVEAGQWWVFFVGILFWPEQWPRLLRVLAISLAGVAMYAMAHHAFYQFRVDQSMLAPIPFFPNNTVYGAVLVMVLVAAPGIGDQSRTWRLLLIILLLALVFSFSRAAWLSLAVAGFAGAAWFFRRQWPWIVGVAGLALGAGFFFQDTLSARLASDVSSRERLNRYSCALRMARDRPVTGFGPGTFQFQFIPYQQKAEMTRISITAPLIRRGQDNYGRGGGAHSEYLQALAELGWPGLTLWLVLVIGSITAGVQRYRKTRQLIYLFGLLSLLSFFLHGLVNNYLHDARVAALVWGQMAFIFTADSGLMRS